MAKPWDMDEVEVYVNGEQKSYTPNGDTVRELVERVVDDHDFRTADVRVDGREIDQDSNAATQPAKDFGEIRVSKHTTVGG